MVLAPRTSSLPKLLLKPGRWTVGSAATCSYRIVGDGVQPRHALVLCGGQTTVLKAWDARTFHNGQPVVGEVRLQPGDRVTFGSVEFSIESESPSQPAVTPTGGPRESVPSVRASSAPTAEPEGWNLERLREQIQELRDELSQRVLRRSEAVVVAPVPTRDTAQDGEKTAARIAELERSLAEARSLAEQAQRELAAARDELARRESESQPDVNAQLAWESAQQEIANLRRDLERQQADAVHQEQAWQQHTADWSAERKRWQAELVSLANAKQQFAAEWEQRQATALDEAARWKTECEQIRAGWQMQQAAWDDERAKLQAQATQHEETAEQSLQPVTQHEHELAEQSQQLLVERQQFEAERQQFQTERQEYDRTIAALTDERQHVEQHADEVLAKFAELARQTTELEQQQAKLAREQQTLEHSWNWLQSDRRKLVEEKEEWQQQRAHWQAEREHWIAESEQLQRDREEFARSRELWNEQHAATRQLTVEREQLAVERQRLHDEQSAWGTQREQFEAECQSKVAELEAAREELRSQRQSLCDEREQLDAMRMDLEARAAKLEREQTSWRSTPRDAADSDWTSVPASATPESLQPSASNEASLSPLSTLSDAWNIGVDLTELREPHAAERTMPRDARPLDDATSPTEDRQPDSASPEPLWKFESRPTSPIDDSLAVAAAPQPDASAESEWETTKTPPSESNTALPRTSDPDSSTSEPSAPTLDAAEPVMAIDSANVDPETETTTAPKAGPVVSILESMAFADDEDVDDSVSRYMQHLLARSQQPDGAGRERYIPAHSLKPSAPSTLSANGPSGKLIPAESPFVVGHSAAKEVVAPATLSSADGSSDPGSTASCLPSGRALDKDALRAATEHMRHVANQQTVKNVEAANWKQLKRSIKSKLVLAGLSFLISAGLLVWGYYERPDFLILGVCASGLGILTWLDLILAIRQARARMLQLTGRKKNAGPTQP